MKSTKDIETKAPAPEWLELPWMYKRPVKSELYEDWLNKWSAFVLDWSESEGIHDIHVHELQRKKPFNKLSDDDLLEILEHIVRRRRGKWLDKGKTRLNIVWRPLEEWAKEVYSWILRSAIANRPIGIHQLAVAGRGFSTLPQSDLQEILRIMVDDGMARWWPGMEGRYIEAIRPGVRPREVRKFPLGKDVMVTIGDLQDEIDRLSAQLDPLEVEKTEVEAKIEDLIRRGDEDSLTRAREEARYLEGELVPVIDELRGKKQNLETVIRNLLAVRSDEELKPLITDAKRQIDRTQKSVRKIELETPAIREKIVERRIRVKAGVEAIPSSALESKVDERLRKISRKVLAREEGEPAVEKRERLKEHERER